MNRTLTWALSILLPFMSACSLEERADRMGDDLAQVRTQTANLANRGEDATADLSYAVSYQVLVLGNLDKIFGENESFWSGWVGAKPKDPDILFYATSAIDAMWFQTWRARAGEGLASLDVRLKTGLEILLGITYKHAPWDGDVNVLIPDRSFKGLASLAVNLDRVRPEFADAWARTGAEDQVSLYSVMLDALATRDSPESESRFPRARTMVLRRPDSAIYLLQLRHNYLPVMAIGLMTGFGRANVVNQGVRAAVDQDVDLTRVTAAQLDEWSELLNAARETRDALRSLGVEPTYNRTLTTVARSIERSMTTAANADPGDPAEVSARARGFGDTLASRRRAFARQYLNTLPPPGN